MSFGLGKNSPPSLFLCGDVMTGRGIDQMLPHPDDPVLYESYIKSAKDYVKLAEAANGPIPLPAQYDYIWGGALEEWDRRRPDVRIVNLETSITRSPDFWKNKGINYRMSPENSACLRTAGIDCCCLANNHVLDWGIDGLNETIEVLDGLGIQHAGAGRNRNKALTPARFPVQTCQIAVFSMGTESSGAPREWSASVNTPGVCSLEDLSLSSAWTACDQMAEYSQRGDRTVFSIHWGDNWGYAIPEKQWRFAHALIDDGCVDLIHGHSSHHPKGIEVYRGKLILYGCGDFINDYEGIGGYEFFRGDLCLMYFATLEAKTGDLSSLEMVPFQIRKFRLNRPSVQDVTWLHGILDRECRALGTSVEKTPDGFFRLNW